VTTTNLPKAPCGAENSRLIFLQKRVKAAAAAPRLRILTAKKRSYLLTFCGASESLKKRVKNVRKRLKKQMTTL